MKSNSHGGSSGSVSGTTSEFIAGEFNPLHFVRGIEKCLTGDDSRSAHELPGLRLRTVSYEVERKSIMKVKVQSVCGALALTVLTSAQAFADKEAARDFYTGASCIGGAAIATPAGQGALIGQGIGLIGMGIWDRFFASVTLPDPDHGILASITPVHFTPFSGVGGGIDELNDSIVWAAKIIDESRLTDQSLRKYYGALADGNVTDAATQQAAASQAFFGLVSVVGGYRNSLLSVSAAMAGTEFASIFVPKPDVLALRDQIVATGFPSYESFVFSQMNATSLEINLAIGEVSLMTGNFLGPQISGATIFSDLSWSLGQVNLRELLPGDFVLVPTPGSVALLCFGGILAFGRRQR